MKQSSVFILTLILGGVLLLVWWLPSGVEAQEGGDPNPPGNPVKLIFIHHSTGENWLTDGYGDLGRVLAQNNYFVSDTNYGWGPEGIGDRTDIPNWDEWFRSENTPRYMDALFQESGQNSSYTRSFGDPGGENQIVMFKSCFPNSDLSGNPDDPAQEGYDLTVGNAKWIYNEILKYFATRPDKLFIVITAPPLSDDTHADNARAFNNWLLNDWLPENNYALNNVAVFDFYNILTDASARHSFQDGQVLYTVGNQNTLYYPSGDDHPSEQGSRKATEEFLPLLNVFYHRWAASLEQAPVSTEGEQGAIASPDAGLSPTEAPVAELPPASEALSSEEIIDSFDDSSSNWEAFKDESTASLMSCAVEGGSGLDSSAALRMDFTIAPAGWGTCALMYDAPQNWSAGQGIAFMLRSDRAGLIFNVDLYAGSPDNRQTFAYSFESPTESVANWVPVQLFWQDFHRVDWEENAGAPFTDPASIVGVGYGFSPFEDAAASGNIWIDNLGLRAEGETSPPVMDPTREASELQPEPTDTPLEGESSGGGLSCLGVQLSLVGAGLVWVWARRRKKF